MINYNTTEIIQCLRQYDMFSNSLKVIEPRSDKNMVIAQLTKLENKIVELTDEIYKEEYYKLANKETTLLKDEKERLDSLISIINQRLSYLEKRNNNHYQLTGEVTENHEVLGADTLSLLEERLEIISKYEKNNKIIEELTTEIENLNSKISLAEEKIDINNSLNKELEKKMKTLLKEAFEKLNLYSLLDNKDEIEYTFYETEKCLNLAKQNFEISKTSPSNIMLDCQNMLLDIEKDYSKYKEKICLIKLMEIYDKEVETYDDLLIKRKEINELIKNIKDNDINHMIYDTITKQYETIIEEMADTNNYNNLVDEKNDKENTLSEIEEENNSERFQDILGELLENERKEKKRQEEEKKRIEEEEKQRRLEIERKKQEEILKKQKIIEEARKKEVEKRTKELLKEQQNSILQSKNKQEGYSFETIKNISDTEEEPEVEPTNEKEPIEEENAPIFKNKIDIEKELFAEFNETSKKDTPETSQEEDNQLPDMSIDEYMNNFNENDVKADLQDLFKDDDIFPNIPL